MRQLNPGMKGSPHLTADQASISTLGHSTYERLRGAVLNGELPAGTSLQEKKLAERLGVRARQCRKLIRTMMEGLVLRTAGLTRSCAVSPLTAHPKSPCQGDYSKSEAAGRTAKTGGSAELRAIAARIAEFRDGYEPTPEEHVAVDDRHCKIICGSCGIRHAGGMIDDLRKGQNLRHGTVARAFWAGVHEHLEIIDAVLARDVTYVRRMRCELTSTMFDLASPDHLRRLF